MRLLGRHRCGGRDLRWHRGCIGSGVASSEDPAHVWCSPGLSCAGQWSASAGGCGICRLSDMLPQVRRDRRRARRAASTGSADSPRLHRAICAERCARARRELHRPTGRPVHNPVHDRLDQLRLGWARSQGHRCRGAGTNRGHCQLVRGRTDGQLAHRATPTRFARSLEESTTWPHRRGGTRGRVRDANAGRPSAPCRRRR